MQNQAEPILVPGASPGAVEGGVLPAGILKYDLAPASWASLEGTESSGAEAGAAKGTRCLGHPDTCREHKHGSAMSGHRLCLARVARPTSLQPPFC